MASRIRNAECLVPCARPDDNEAQILRDEYNAQTEFKKPCACALLIPNSEIRIPNSVALLPSCPLAPLPFIFSNEPQNFI